MFATKGQCMPTYRCFHGLGLLSFAQLNDDLYHDANEVAF
jgi:hypothetical protein